ncbi:MAG: acetyltransferase [Rivularia sp. (in: Bacteria)]|nr:acetyltransferase [Rivularia sp. MS3]
MEIYLYGCGGHAKVILDIFDQQGKSIKALIDDNPPSTANQIHGVPIYRASEALSNISIENSKWIIAIGNNRVRKQIALKFENQGYSFTTAIHPSAKIALGVEISPGTVVMANSVINTDTKIGTHAIINTGSLIDHDCHIGDYTHISPGCTLCGHVKVGKNVLLGANTTVSPCLEIGNEMNCQPGSIITKSLSSISI